MNNDVIIKIAKISKTYKPKGNNTHHKKDFSNINLQYLLL